MIYEIKLNDKGEKNRAFRNNEIKNDFLIDLVFILFFISDCFLHAFCS